MTLHQDITVGILCASAFIVAGIMLLCFQHNIESLTRCFSYFLCKKKSRDSDSDSSRNDDITDVEKANESTRQIGDKASGLQENHLLQQENSYTEYTEELNIITRSSVVTKTIENATKAKVMRKPPAIPPKEDNYYNLNNPKYINVPTVSSKEDMNQKPLPPRPPKKNNQAPVLPPKKTSS